MTLEEADRRALAAVENGDLAALQAAIAARASAIAALAGTPASPELAGRLASSVDAGASVHDKLSGLKVRLRTDRARVARMQAALLAGLAPARTSIDLRG
jgi:hypothetical protein